MPDLGEDLAYFDQRLVQQDTVEMSVIPQDRQNLIKTNKKAFDGF